MSEEVTADEIAEVSVRRQCHHVLGADVCAVRTQELAFGVPLVEVSGRGVVVGVGGVEVAGVGVHVEEVGLLHFLDVVAHGAGQGGCHAGVGVTEDLGGTDGVELEGVLRGGVVEG